MSNLFLAATTAKDIATNNPEYVSYTIAAISSMVTGVFSYLIGKRKSNKSDFSELVVANTKFRDEIKKEFYKFYKEKIK